MTSNLNWVDYIFIAIFLFSMLAGFGRGLVKEVVSLATLVAAFVVATMFANSLALQFTSSASVQSVVSDASNAIGVNAAQPVSYAAIGLSFGLLFAGTVIVGAIVGFFLNMAFSVGILGFGNRILGALFGLCRGFIINLVIIFMFQLTTIGTSTWWVQSQIVQMYQPSVVWLGAIVSPSLANLKQKATDALQNAGTKIQNLTY
jgi:membrane protein required for colicin V production